MGVETESNDKGINLEVDSEAGGIVTTVKKEVTDDIDVQDALRADAEEHKGDEPAKPKGDEPAKSKGNEPVKDGGDELLDFKSLSPQQQKAVAKLYKEQRKMNREMREMRETINGLRSKPAGKEDGNMAPARREDDLKRPERPDPQKFDSDEDFNKAEQKYEDDLYDYRREKERRKKEADEAESERQKAIDAYNKKVDEFMEEHDDYEDVMDQSTPMSAVMFGAVIENGPALGYYFGTHPEEAKKIYDMSENDAYKAITRIVVKLEDEAVDKKKEEPPARSPKKKEQEPPAHLKGGGGAPPIDKSKLSFREREKAFAKDNPGALNYEP